MDNFLASDVPMNYIFSNDPFYFFSPPNKMRVSLSLSLSSVLFLLLCKHDKASSDIKHRIKDSTEIQVGEERRYQVAGTIACTISSRGQGLDIRQVDISSAFSSLLQ